MLKPSLLGTLLGQYWLSVIFVHNSLPLFHAVKTSRLYSGSIALVLRWLTTVLMEYKSTTFNSFEKGSKLFLPSPFIVCLSLLPFYVKFEQQMAKMSDRVPNERLGTSRVSHVFLKIYPRELVGIISKQPS